MAKPVLHKSGKTRFTIQNIDYGILTQALLNYQKFGWSCCSSGSR